MELSVMNKLTAFLINQRLCKPDVNLLMYPQCSRRGDCAVG